jgi:hypothetical protein
MLECSVQIENSEQYFEQELCNNIEEEKEKSVFIKFLETYLL